jgi:hypothetical protein
LLPGEFESSSLTLECTLALLTCKGWLDQGNDDRRLVIKAIDKQRVKNVGGLQRISHEIEALRTLRHPNILALSTVLHGTSCSTSASPAA